MESCWGLTWCLQLTTYHWSLPFGDCRILKVQVEVSWKVQVIKIPTVGGGMPMPTDALAAFTRPSAAPGITMNVSNMMVFHGPANLQLWPVSIELNRVNPVGGQNGFPGGGDPGPKPPPPPPKAPSPRTSHNMRDEDGCDGGDGAASDSDSCSLCRSNSPRDFGIHRYSSGGYPRGTADHVDSSRAGGRPEFKSSTRTRAKKKADNYKLKGKRTSKNVDTETGDRTESERPRQRPRLSSRT